MRRNSPLESVRTSSKVINIWCHRAGYMACMLLAEERFQRLFSLEKKTSRQKTFDIVIVVFYQYRFRQRLK